MKAYDVCMTIAGSDPSGGAGVQADLKTFTLLGCYGQAAVTALTVQNTQGVKKSVAVDEALVFEQIEVVMSDWLPQAVKIGMVPNAAVARGIARALRSYRPRFVVYDPVMVSTSGLRLMLPETLEVVRTELLPCCTLLTPNLPEARVLAGNEHAEAEVLARRLCNELQLPAILVKGGHRSGEPVDVLYDGNLYAYTAPRIDTPNAHGTGCVLSSAIAAFVAKGQPLQQAVGSAKQFLTSALQRGRNYTTGKGSNGPLYLLPCPPGGSSQ